MDWNDQQAAALASVQQWFENGANQAYHLFGYAGTGKTTLALALAKACGGTVLFGAFTGKASLVLRQKGCPAETIHRLIYTPKDKSSVSLTELKNRYRDLLMDDLGVKITAAQQQAHDAKCRGLAREITTEEKRLKQPAFSLNPDSEVRFANLVIIDEVSMVGRRMAEDLLSFGTKLLVLGDPAQLPPVGDGGFFTEGEPDTLLTEIHRQALGSPVVYLATEVRQGHDLPLGTYGDSVVATKGTFSIQEIAKFDQILCGRNKTRRVINRRIREEVLGRMSPFPEPSDRLVCLRNNHELGLLNGSLWTVQDVNLLGDESEFFVVVKGEDGRVVETVAHKATFLGEEISFHDRRNADEFDFGYALTVHKAQGSQWGSVFIVDESGCFKPNANRWLYTAITRASDLVAVVR